MNRGQSVARRASLAALALLLLASAARADTMYLVTLDTSSLVGHPGTFSVDFQFTDGAGTGDGNNVVSLSSFAFGSGAPTAGTASITGDVSGRLDLPPVVLRDTQAFNEFIQDFTPGIQLGFVVDLTGNPESDPTLSDTLAFALLVSGLNIATSNPNGSFLEIDLNALAPPTVIASASVDPSFPIGPPTIQLLQVPEPSSLVLTLSGLGVAAIHGLRRSFGRGGPGRRGAHCPPFSRAKVPSRRRSVARGSRTGTD